MKTYSGSIIEKASLRKVASGGIATALSEIALESGWVVFGVSYSEDFKSAEYICIDNKSELHRLQGSKYVETKKNYDLLMNKLKAGKRILYFGLGCDIGAIKTLCKNKGIDDSKLYTIDLLCHGPASKVIHKKYIEDLEARYNSRIKAYSTKYKKEGWIPPYIRAEFSNGKVYEEIFEYTDFGYAFSNFALPRCTNCQFKGENHKGDLCIGDFWGVSKEMTQYNKDGVSIIVVQTDKGNELISMLDGRFSLSEVDIGSALIKNPMYYKSREQGKQFEEFNSYIKTRGLHESLKECSDYAVWQKNIKKIKLKRRILHLLKKHH